MYNDRTYIRLWRVTLLKEIRFIHTADLHLDSPFLGLSHLPEKIFSHIQESTFTAFQKVVDAALESDVDFIVIVGDLFDGEDRSIKAQARLRRQLERLKEAEIDAFISYGNHDHLAGNWLTLEMPTNVHLFNNQVEAVSFTAKNGLNVHLYGFSYPERHVFERKVQKYQKLPGADLHIGLLHGQWEESNASHQPYAPFSKKELLEKDFDYWALGHIHQRQILHSDPYIVYPGNIQGRHRKEEGKKGCYEVKISLDGTTHLRFIETSELRWKTESIILEKNTTLTELYSICDKMMESMLVGSSQSILLQLTIENPTYLSQSVKQKVENREFLEMLQDEVNTAKMFIWPYDIKVEQDTTGLPLYSDSFLNMLNETSESMLGTEEFEESLSSLFSHVYASRYLYEMEESEKGELMEAAKKIVMEKLKE